MSDPTTAFRQLLQDLVTPDLKAIVVRQDAADKRFDAIDKRFDAIDKRFDRQDRNLALQTEVLIKTIDAFRAEMIAQFAIQSSELRLEFQSQIAPLSERVAVLEAIQRTR